MSVVASALILIGAGLTVLAGLGLLRFDSTFARLHAAGKASPVAFLVIATGAALEVGGGGAAQLGVAALAMVLTLPVGVHVLFRAVHRVDPGDHLAVDELAAAQEQARDT